MANEYKLAPVESNLEGLERLLSEVIIQFLVLCSLLNGRVVYIRSATNDTAMRYFVSMSGSRMPIVHTKVTFMPFLTLH